MWSRRFDKHLHACRKEGKKRNREGKERGEIVESVNAEKATPHSVGVLMATPDSAGGPSNTSG